MQILVLASLAIALIGLRSPIRLGPQIPTWQAGLMTLATAAAAAGLFWGYNRRVTRQIDRTGQLNRPAYRRRLNILGWAMLALFAGQVFMLHWPLVVTDLLQAGRVPVVAEMLAWAPFVAMLLGYWAAAYSVDARLRMLDLRHRIEAALPVYAPGGDRPIWSLGQFLRFQIRYHLLLILLPLTALLVMDLLVAHVIGRLTPWIPSASARESLTAALLLATAAAVLVFSPPLLAWTFSSQPLPAGELRDKLARSLSRLRVRVRRILLWNTHGMVSNAAVMGPWGRLRYVMLSDGLLETLADEQIEGVFGHELGHVVHHHLIYLAMALISLSGWASLACSAIERVPLVRWALDGPDWLAAPIEVTLAGGALAGVLLTFGWVSRRFEWQADLAGAQSIVPGQWMNSPFSPPAIVASDGAPIPADLDSPPSPAAVEIYVCALFRIADVNGLDRDHRTWRHGSIASRGQHLRRLCDPEAFSRFTTTVHWVKLLTLLSAAGAVAVSFVW